MALLRPPSLLGASEGLMVVHLQRPGRHETDSEAEFGPIVDATRGVSGMTRRMSCSLDIRIPW